MSKARRLRDYRRLNRRLTKVIDSGGENRMLLNVVPFHEAMLDWRIGEGATRFMFQAFKTAQNLTDDRLACFCCCKEWAERRVPVGCLILEFINLPEDEQGDVGLLSGICRECMIKGPSEIMRAVERDLPHTSRQYLAEEGHA